MFKFMSIFALGGSVAGFTRHLWYNEEAPYQIWFMLVIGLLCLILSKQEQ